MDDFRYRNGTLYCEQVPVALLATSFGTPLYLYSRATITDHYRKLERAFSPVKPLICYAVKSSSTLGMLALLRDLGSGFDVVSGGELYRVLRAGGDPRKVVFAGVGKGEKEMAEALRAGILSFNVESEGELHALDAVARKEGWVARVALRFNPDVDPHTFHQVTTGKMGTKFGMDPGVVRKLLTTFSSPHIELSGLHFHLGSQITTTAPYREAVKRTLELISSVKDRARITRLNIGGGFGIFYDRATALPAEGYAREILPLLAGSGLEILMEPGRFVVGNAGLLVTRSLYEKITADGHRYLICDAGMSELLRPSLYQAFHRVWPVTSKVPMPPWGEEIKTGISYDVVGPICESTDTLARERLLPEVAPGDLLAVFSCGAYGMSMSSNYNSRCRPAEVLVEGDTFRLIRERESYADLCRGEIL